MNGKTVNGYTLKRLLGKGGMAEVWYAETKIGTVGAVKILNPDLSLNENIAKRFLQEAKVTAKLNHPNIRQVLNYDEIEGRPCMIMEYLEGDDLKARMQRGERFSQQQLEKWWGQLVSALNYTHAKDIVHRDIKPANIFITSDGDVKLLDFGIAKVRDSLTATSTGAQMGTLMYMSPEQIRDSKHIDFKTDIYSLAVTFVQLLTGVAPYDSNSTDDLEMRINIATVPLDLEGVPAAWKQFLTPYLEKEPQKRPALKNFSGEAVAQPVDATAIETPQAATPVDEEATAIIDSPKPATPKLPKPKKKLTWLWILLGVTALLAVGVVAWLFTNRGDDLTPTEEVVTSKITVEEGDGWVKFDGEKYKTVKLGDQVWMAENIRATKDKDGKKIPLGDETSYETPYRYCPDANSANVSEYGYLYNWAAAKKVCPDGWHLPTDAEWTQLENYVSSQGGYVCGNDEDYIAKALASNTGWEHSSDKCDVGNNLSSNNATGFSALPAGTSYGSYSDFGYYAAFWSATEYSSGYAYYRFLGSGNAYVYRYNANKSSGFSVRCLRD